ncbi:MAG: hypothetical protein ACRC8S_08485 [Fimbriiglobus sp.]
MKNSAVKSWFRRGQCWLALSSVGALGAFGLVQAQTPIDPNKPRAAKLSAIQPVIGQSHTARGVMPEPSTEPKPEWLSGPTSTTVRPLTTPVNVPAPVQKPGLVDSAWKDFKNLVAGPSTPKQAPVMAPPPAMPTTQPVGYQYTQPNSNGVYAGPPAYRWYGWGTTTPGRNPHAPDGRYPRGSSNWYAQTGATPGAFPVTVNTVGEPIVGAEPPAYAGGYSVPRYDQPSISSPLPTEPVTYTPSPIPTVMPSFTPTQPVTAPTYSPPASNEPVVLGSSEPSQVMPVSAPATQPMLQPAPVPVMEARPIITPQPSFVPTVETRFTPTTPVPTVTAPPKMLPTMPSASAPATPSVSWSGTRSEAVAFVPSAVKAAPVAVAKPVEVAAPTVVQVKAAEPAKTPEAPLEFRAAPAAATIPMTAVKPVVDVKPEIKPVVVPAPAPMAPTQVKPATPPAVSWNSPKPASVPAQPAKPTLTESIREAAASRAIVSEVKTVSPTKLVIRLQAATAEDCKAAADAISKMPQLKPFTVDFEVTSSK